MNDPRNLIDAYKGMEIKDIVDDLDGNGVELEIAVENLNRDYNMGTIVRSANAFGVRNIHVIGRRQWNKRGAMMTDKYLHIHYHSTIDAFIEATRGKTLIAIDNTPGAVLLADTTLPPTSLLIFGAEGPGISAELREKCQKTVAIEQFGSTRCVNVGVAAGIAMYEWLRQNVLS